MTVFELKQFLQVYPEHFEVLISHHGQDDIFTTIEGCISGKFSVFPEEYFESCIGEIKNEEKRNCIGLVRKIKKNGK